MYNYTSKVRLFTLPDQSIGAVLPYTSKVLLPQEIDEKITSMSGHIDRCARGSRRPGTVVQIDAFRARIAILQNARLVIGRGVVAQQIIVLRRQETLDQKAAANARKATVAVPEDLANAVDPVVVAYNAANVLDAAAVQLEAAATALHGTLVASLVLSNAWKAAAEAWKAADDAWEVAKTEQRLANLQNVSRNLQNVSRKAQKSWAKSSKALAKKYKEGAVPQATADALEVWARNFETNARALHGQPDSINAEADEWAKAARAWKLAGKDWKAAPAKIALPAAPLVAVHVAPLEDLPFPEVELMPIDEDLPFPEEDLVALDEDLPFLAEPIALRALLAPFRFYDFCTKTSEVLGERLFEGVAKDVPFIENPVVRFAGNLTWQVVKACAVTALIEKAADVFSSAQVNLNDRPLIEAPLTRGQLNPVLGPNPVFVQRPGTVTPSQSGNAAPGLKHGHHVYQPRHHHTHNAESQPAAQSAVEPWGSLKELTQWVQDTKAEADAAKQAVGRATQIYGKTLTDGTKQAMNEAYTAWREKYAAYKTAASALHQAMRQLTRTK